MNTILTKTTHECTIHLKLSDDGMKLFLEGVPNGPAEVGRGDILRIIAEKLSPDKVHVEILDDIVSLLRQGKTVKERRIFKGTNPEPGRDGRLVLLVRKLSKTGEVTLDARGFTNFFDRHLYENVPKGRVVARLYSPGRGMDGYDGLGRRIPSAPGKPLALILGQGLEIVPSGASDHQEIRAVTDGCLDEESGKLFIRTELVFDEGIGYKTGNIDFIGTVRVKGDVAQGFSVKGRQGVLIEGAFSGEEAVSQEGNVTIQGFAYGGANAQVVARRDFIGTVAQELTVTAGGTITIEKQSLDCTLRADASIRSERGSIIGGALHAGETVRAAVLGNEAEKATRIMLAEQRDGAPAVLRGFERRLAEHDKAITLLKAHLGPYADNSEKTAILPEQFREKTLGLLEKLQAIQASRNSLVQELEGFAAVERQKAPPEAIFSKRLHAGVSVTIKGRTITLTSTVEGPGSVRLHDKTKDIEVLSLQGIKNGEHAD